MRYTQPKDVWAMTTDQIRQMQPGQWVYAGEQTNKGQFLGVTQRDTVVVAWYGNAKNGRVYIDYIRCLRNFAKGR